MLSKGEAVVYKCKGLYKVAEIGKLNFSFADKEKDYYTLQSVEDERDKAYVPVDDHRNIRKPVSREEALDLIGRVPEIEMLIIKNEKFREQEYKNCIADFCPENWVKVLKTTYNRTKKRGSITSVDRKYQTLLEHALNSEFSFAIGVPAAQINTMIRQKAS